MTLVSCMHEREIRQLLASGAWPQAGSAELRVHAAHCRSCGDLILVTQGFRSARQVAAAQARLEAPGVIWWRAQLRRRQAAIERLARPVLGAEIFALAITLMVALGLTILQGQQGFRWFSGLAEALQSHGFRWQSLFTASSALLGISEMGYSFVIPALLVLGLLISVIGYLVWDELK